MSPILEADWKVFKKIKERALEKYCLECIAEYTAIMNRSDLSPHERYLLNYKTVQERDETLARIFNGLSRSRAFMQLVSIRMNDLADDDLVSQLSEEYRARTDPKHFL